MRVFLDALRQIGRDLAGQKLRTALTVFGIVWGTAAVSLLLSFGESMHEQMLRNAAGIGQGVVINFPGRTSIPYQGLGKGRALRVTYEDVERLRRSVPLLARISPEYQASMIVQADERRLSVSISGVAPAFAEIRNTVADPGGRFLNALDERDRRRSAFLGTQIKKDLFGAADPVGTTIHMDGIPFLVVGVMKEKILYSNYAGPDENRIFVPASTLRALSGQEEVDLFVYKADTVAHTPHVKRGVQAALARSKRFAPEDEEAMMVWDTTDARAFFSDFMAIFKSFLAVVGSFTLIVGGIGVSNIMNVVVEERTHEIGIKMALGASPARILWQLLIESLAVVAAGGAAGLALTWTICAIIPTDAIREFVGEPRMTPGIAIVTVVLLGLIGVVAGWFPARTAARLDPVVAMRL
jgi:putative ABC transport system permease protein